MLRLRSLSRQRASAASGAGSLWLELRPEPIDLAAPGMLSFRWPARNPLLRLLAHVLIRRLVIAGFPSDWQLLRLVFPLNLFIAAPAKDASGAPARGGGVEASSPMARESGDGIVGEVDGAVEPGEGPCHRPVGGEHDQILAQGKGNVERVEERRHVLRGQANGLRGQRRDGNSLDADLEGTRRGKSDFPPPRFSFEDPG